MDNYINNEFLIKFKNNIKKALLSKEYLNNNNPYIFCFEFLKNYSNSTTNEFMELLTKVNIYFDDLHDDIYMLLLNYVIYSINLKEQSDNKDFEDRIKKYWNKIYPNITDYSPTSNFINLNTLQI